MSGTYQREQICPDPLLGIDTSQLHIMTSAKAKRQRSMYTTRHTLALLIVAGIYLAIAGLSLMPSGSPVKLTTGWDKFDHMLAYFVVMALAGVIAQRPRYLIGLGIATIAYAGILELAQSFVPGRDVSSADFLASTLGALLGLGLASISLWVPKWWSVRMGVLGEEHP